MRSRSIKCALAFTILSPSQPNEGVSVCRVGCADDAASSALIVSLQVQDFNRVSSRLSVLLYIACAPVTSYGDAPQVAHLHGRRPVGHGRSLRLQKWLDEHPDVEVSCSILATSSPSKTCFRAHGFHRVPSGSFCTRETVEQHILLTSHGTELLSFYSTGINRIVL